ncbi:putative satD protein [Streptococcus criceti]|uniref:SatD protein n=1 Tax=Streptococcus criceti HS-6 TaxID=873449 RepID=G5JP29_STRCG|nr:SatD family protein [Streptococcus criceti]EHI75233.1 SatD protein [Streptococcus criceti HS-6]SUN43438.1 putative satD protein [Streptococcus criceti]
MTYLALIGDIINSKELKDRAQVQEQLLGLMQAINKDYASVIVSPFTVTTGDEFQALLRPSDNIFQIIDNIQMQLLPVQIRFGLGLGEMLTPINDKQSIGSDGPAFWWAREAINHVHDKTDYGVARIALSCDNQLIQESVNSLLASGDFIKSKWTANQLAILKALLEQQSYQEQFEHQMIADALGIKPSGFSKRLKASGLKHYLRSRKAAAHLIIAASRSNDQQQSSEEENHA